MRDVLACSLPEYDSVRIDDSNLAQVVPAEYRADLVVLLQHDVPVFGIVVEVQLAPDPDKRFSWPYYAAALRVRLHCPACVLVVAANERTARWAEAAINTGQPGAPFVPLVLGPAAVPRITDAAVARQAPEQALLSAFAHGNEPAGLEVVLAALAATAGMDEERSMLYCD